MVTQRATRGKTLRFSFGASIHRAVSLDLADAVFEPGTTEIRLQWQPRMDLLLAELRKAPSVLRLSYLADVEDEQLVQRRLKAVKQQILDAWKAADSSYALEVEPEVFWRRGGPPKAARAGVGQVIRMQNSRYSLLACALLACAAGHAQSVGQSQIGEDVERQLPADQPYSKWVRDLNQIETDAGDQIEKQMVAREGFETVKLRNVIPSVRFDSGIARIPEKHVDMLREALDKLRDRRNVRLHLVGHADDQRLSGALAQTFGDNAGLSRERAGEVAEYLQKALLLRPDAVSYEWAGDTKPIASNATAQGRALNRRVEVEVWYDEPKVHVAEEEVLVQANVKQVKVCRVETLCKMRFKEGQTRRTRLKNLVPALHYVDENTEVPADFIEHVHKALDNLKGKQNVVVKLIGYTDDAPLSERNQRIYGDALALSKARAHRVALVVQEALKLPDAVITSEGRGATLPLGSNDTAQGRAMNRRVEVQFWHDDPLQELPEEPQMCPDENSDEVVTRVYDPPWGTIAPLQLENGRAIIPPGYTESLRRAMADISARNHVRLRFVGYTGNQTLDRRTASVYGDDIGLSAARAQRAMETIREQMQLAPEKAEHEGRGYVQSPDVVNRGFTQGEDSYVVVQVVYDELAVRDDYEGVDITRLTRELTPKSQYGLNLMHISVDGKPIDDPDRSSCRRAALHGRGAREGEHPVPVRQSEVAAAAGRHGRSAGCDGAAGGQRAAGRRSGVLQDVH